MLPYFIYKFVIFYSELDNIKPKWSESTFSFSAAAAVDSLVAKYVNNVDFIL